MKAEINAATEFLSRIFLAHDNIKKEKVAEFRQRLATLLEERFRDHWHESCPVLGQAYRCIRINPEECLDPLIEKVCSDVGVSVKDFNLPFELTLWVDPTEVVCKFGDLKCSYHTVAKKDQTSGNLNSQTENLDIDDLVENARELYLKKQTVVVHPVNSTEMHVQSPYADGSPSNFTMAVRMSGTVHCNMSGSPPPGFDGSPRGRGKPPHMTHKRGGGYHYYGKSSGGKGGFVANGVSNGTSMHAAASHHGYPHHRSHNQHHHQQQHHHPHGSGGHHNPSVTYSNGYLNGYSDENGYAGFDHRSVSPTKINGMSVLPPLSISGGPVQISPSPPTPEQLQQQLQHPPPMPPSVPPHLSQTFSHPHTDISTLPPPPLPSQHQLPPPATSASITTTSNNSSSSSSINNNSGGSGSGKSTGHGSKFQGIRGHTGSRNKQSSAVKEVK